MQRYILIRIIQGIFVLWAVSVLVFGLARLSGDPIVLMLPLDAEPGAYERLQKFWGLDKSYPEQYRVFITNAIRLDFGDSIKWPGRSARSLLKDPLIASLQLTLTALVFAAVIAVILGVLSATWKDTPLDFGAKIFALLGQSAPDYWIGLMLIWIFAVELGWFPTSGKGGISNMVLPVFTLSWFQIAAIMRLVRSSMLDVLDSEYVKLARIKGVPEWKVIWKHSLRNASIAPLTFFGMTATSLITGAVIVETVFAWPGIGKLAVDAVLARDFQVVQMVALVFTIGYVGLNLLVDVLYAYLDPRIRYG